MDVANAGFFVDSTLSYPSFSTKDESCLQCLDGYEEPRFFFFFEDRCAALWVRWSAVTRQGPVGPIQSFEPWTKWIPPGLHGVYKWVMDAISLLSLCTKSFKEGRKACRSQAWSNWIREDLSSHPFQWLLPEFVPPAMDEA